MHQSEAAFAFSQRQVPRISSIIWNSFCLCFHERESHATRRKIKVKLSVPKELQSYLLAPGPDTTPLGTDTFNKFR